jgi:hypothetical protein
VTCATPLFRDGTVRISELIWVGRKQKYFCKRGWTGHFGKHEVICPSGKITSYVRTGGAYSSILPGAKVRYAAHIGLTADKDAGPRSAMSSSLFETSSARASLSRHNTGLQVPEKFLMTAKSLLVTAGGPKVSKLPNAFQSLIAETQRSVIALASATPRSLAGRQGRHQSPGSKDKTSTSNDNRRCSRRKNNF